MTDHSDPFHPCTFALLRDDELAARWRISQRTLQRWRSEACGPAYIVIGGSIRYRLADVLAFEARMRRGGSVDQK